MVKLLDMELSSLNRQHYPMTGIAKLLCLISLLGGTPLLGLYFSGSSLGPYIAFPPVTESPSPHSFSWPIFGLLAVFTAIVLSPFLVRFIHFSPSQQKPRPTKIFPWWGWAGAGFLLLSWTLAWSRFPWFEPLQNHTFTPLWMGYIVVINALTVKRTGHCLLTDRPYFFLSLFPLSSGFWWIFEFLNRFVKNWYYVGALNSDPASYFWTATLPFSTVLPAIIGTYEYLSSFSRFWMPFDRWREIPVPNGRGMGWAGVLIASIGLMGIGLWPTLLYPLLWVAPLLTLVGLQRIWGEKGLLEDMQEGNWNPVVIPALSGLVCGFFWEMWNYFSFAHWKYTIPHVQGLQVFEMPFLGYFGYLPFGITCTVFVQFLSGTYSLHSPALGHLKSETLFESHLFPSQSPRVPK